MRAKRSRACLTGHPVACELFADGSAEERARGRAKGEGVGES